MGHRILVVKPLSSLYQDHIILELTLLSEMTKLEFLISKREGLYILKARFSTNSFPSTVHLFISAILQECLKFHFSNLPLMLIKLLLCGNCHQRDVSSN